MIVKWAPELPQNVLVKGFSYSFAPGTTSQEMANGFPRSQRTSPRPKRHTASFDGRTGTFGSFETFWEQTTDFGNLKFWMPGQMHDGEDMQDSETGGTIEDQDGETIQGTSWWLCKFAFANGEGPTVTADSGTWFSTAFPIIIFPI